MGATILIAAVGEIESRFSAHISEIWRLLALYGFPVGEPGSVRMLAEGLCEEGPFREDLSSLLRVIRGTEPEISRLELLGVLLVAAGGPENVQAGAGTPEFEGASRSILRFVREVCGSVKPDNGAAPRNLRMEPADARAGEGLEDEPGVDDRVDRVDRGMGEPVDERSNEPVLERVYERAEGVLNPGGMPFSLGSAGSSRSPHALLARALALAADGETFGGAGRRLLDEDGGSLQVDAMLTPREIVPPAVDAEPADVALPAPEEAPVAGGGARPAVRLSATWIAAVCGLVLGLLLGLLWRGREPPRAPLGEASKTQASLASTARRGTRSAAVRQGRAEDKAGSRSPEVPSAGNGVSDVETASSKAAVPSPRMVSPSSPTVDAPARTRGSASPVHSEVSAVAPLAVASAPDGAGTRLPMARVVAGSSGIMAAYLISSPVPAYPPQASAAQVQGEVVVAAVVGRDGSVIEARVVSGPLPLREAALEAVQHWRYRPIVVDGKASEIATTARVEFRLGTE